MKSLNTNQECKTISPSGKIQLEQTRLRPFIKWAGGKRQLLSRIAPLVPAEINRYYEPFLGGGALLFHLQPQRYIVNDINEDLINLYQVIRDRLPQLLAEFSRFENTAEYYYDVRLWDRQGIYDALDPCLKAARFLYLNKTCYNGLYRVNKRGQFNVPFGSNPRISVSEDELCWVSSFLNSQVQGDILAGDFEDALVTASSGDFVYLDPPYDVPEGRQGFTAYGKNGFGRPDQIRLKRQCDKLDKAGCRFLLSNASTEFVRTLYGSYDIQIVKATRNINSVASKRGPVEEVLIKNY